MQIKSCSHVFWLCPPLKLREWLLVIRGIELGTVVEMSEIVDHMVSGSRIFLGADQCSETVAPRAQRSQYNCGFVSYINPTHNKHGLASPSEVAGPRTKDQIMNIKRPIIAGGSEINTFA